MIPADFIYSPTTGKAVLWQRRSFLPRPDKKEARTYNGRSFSLYLPIEVNGATKSYLFTFSIGIGDG